MPERFAFDAIVPLETIDECLIRSIGNVFVNDSSLMVWDRGSANVFVFDRDGRYRHKIGSRGGGPEEYASIEDVYVSGDTVQLMDLSTLRVLRYTTAGEFISSDATGYYLYTFRPVADGCWGINMYPNEDHYNLVLLDKSLRKIRCGYFAS